MNVTFFIGNGFDINLGLKTKYENFYPYFLEKAKENNIIKNWIKNDKILWSDLEKRLGEALQNLDEAFISQFYNDKEEMDLLLLDYLDGEQKRLNLSNKSEIIDELINSLTKFDKGLSKVDRQSIEDTKRHYKNEDFAYNFINFNYTETIDKIVDLVIQNNKVFSHHTGTIARNDYIGEIIHIHGTVNKEMILGVNDESQIKNDLLKKNNEFLDTFVKSRMNKEIGQQKTESVKNLISKSHIICIFGMSLGDTDKIWWEEIVKWLNRDGTNKLIIFWKGYEEVFERKIPARTIRLNNSMKHQLFMKGKGEHDDNVYERIKDRIMISYNTDIFEFKKVKGLV